MEEGKCKPSTIMILNVLLNLDGHTVKSIRRTNGEDE